VKASTTGPESPSRFPLGQLVITRGALGRIPARDVLLALGRHARGDWGDLDDEDWRENERSLVAGCRLLSTFRSSSGDKFWIITEWNRSYTTVLLPEEY